MGENHGFLKCSPHYFLRRDFTQISKGRVLIRRQYKKKVLPAIFFFPYLPLTQSIHLFLKKDGWMMDDQTHMGAAHYRPCIHTSHAHLGHNLDVCIRGSKVYYNGTSCSHNNMCFGHLQTTSWVCKMGSQGKKKRDYLQSYNTLKDFGLLLEDCFEDYILAWWNTWVSIILLLP